MSEVFEPSRLGPPNPVDPLDSSRQSPRRHNKNGSGSSIARVLLLLLAAAVVVVVVLLLVTHPFSHPNATARTGSGSHLGGSQGGAVSGASGDASKRTGTASPSAAPVSERKAAVSLAALLAQSAADRRAVNAADADVSRCGPSLAADQRAFSDAASSRKALLAALAVLPGRGELPPSLLSDLTEAWLASVRSDRPYAQWSADELAQGCVTGNASGQAYLTAAASDGTATAYKTAFTAIWNPLAARFGLTEYQPGQL